MKFCVIRVFTSFFFIVDGIMDDWVVRWLRIDCGLREKREVIWLGRVSVIRVFTFFFIWVRMVLFILSTYLLVLEDVFIWF